MEESNPWPTFVDAFSTVLCIFIFLMLVFVLNSMLIMYESSRKHYQAIETVPTESVDAKSNVKKVLSTDTEPQEIAAKVDLPIAAGIQKEATAGSTAVTAELAATPSTQGAQSVAEIAQDGKLASNEKTEIVTLAENQSSSGSATGRFDVEEAQPTYEIKGNTFIVHFNAMEQGYSTNVVDEMNKWLVNSKPKSVTVYAHVTPQISVSDAMRLAYERGIILLKLVRTKASPGDVSISVINNATVMSNSAVIVKDE